MCTAMSNLVEKMTDVEHTIILKHFKTPKKNCDKKSTSKLNNYYIVMYAIIKKYLQITLDPCRDTSDFVTLA